MNKYTLTDLDALCNEIQFGVDAVSSVQVSIEYGPYTARDHADGLFFIQSALNEKCQRMRDAVNYLISESKKPQTNKD